MTLSPGPHSFLLFQGAKYNCVKTIYCVQGFARFALNLKLQRLRSGSDLNSRFMARRRFGLA